MKKLFVVMSIMTAFAAHGFEVCGPAITADEIAYTPVVALGNSGPKVGYWAIGTGCMGEATADDFANLCTTPSVVGTAYCSSSSWSSSDIEETSNSVGGYCWCRRTQMIVDGTLTDTIGQAVLIGVPGTTYADTDGCNANCARLCAQHVAGDNVGTRQSVLSLPDF